MSRSLGVMVKYSDIKDYCYPNLVDNYPVGDRRLLTYNELADEIDIIKEACFITDLEQALNVERLKECSLLRSDKYFERQDDNNDKLMLTSFCILAADILSVFPLSSTETSKAVQNVAMVAIIAVAIVFTGVLGYSFYKSFTLLGKRDIVNRKIEEHFSQQIDLIQNNTAQSLLDEYNRRVWMRDGVHPSDYILKMLCAPVDPESV